MDRSNSHFHLAREAWESLQGYISGRKIVLDGQSLDIAAVVATSYPRLTTERAVLDKVQSSVTLLGDHLAKGYSVYGVNTGFGGSADSRTNKMIALQEALMQLTQAGVLVGVDRGAQNDANPSNPHAMTPAWVRATMVVRANHSIRGHSAVTVSVIESILDLLTQRITPVVPLRGTVSASGDLMPLAYIAGAIQGSPDVHVRTADGHVRTAYDALRQIGIPHTALGPKEGLGLVNGTAASAALGSLAVYEAHQLAVTTQVLSAMAVEALMGNSESFHPFVAAVRPHAGQIESARNILALLRGSHLALGIQTPKDRNRKGLIQDRYALRSSPQWIGPSLEDLRLADTQIRTELNSSCDNPLVDTETEDVYYGCNFQATAVTSAMEKTRLALQMFGKLLFAQATEIVNPDLSNGLPTNLVADNPSLSFTMKGVDISMAAYMSELAYLAAPTSSHVQSAEMQNQSVNSLAFLSARFTMQAIEVLSLMTACSIYMACQALDLRALHLAFLDQLPVVVDRTLGDLVGTACASPDRDSLKRALLVHMAEAWSTASRLDISDRCQKVVDSALATVLPALEKTGTEQSAAAVNTWRATTHAALVETYHAHAATFDMAQGTPALLGLGSRTVYRIVRHDLRVPFHQGFVEHPTAQSATLDGRAKRTVGSWISIIYEALRAGRFHGPLLHCLDTAERPKARL